MLQTLRKHSGSWFIKILFGVLILSFTAWGIGDVFRNYTRMKPVATVGGTSISYEEFAYAYQQTLSNLQRTVSGKIPVEVLKKLGIPQQVLNSLTNQALLALEINRFGLMVPDTGIRNHIQSLPAFQNDKGQFDRNILHTVLRNNDMTESKLIEETRKSLLHQQLFAPLMAGARFPKAYITRLYETLYERHTFAIAPISADKMAVTAKPSLETLKRLYEENKDVFVMPEYRSLTILVIDPEKLKGQISLDDNQMREIYKERAQDFAKPERRNITQLTFDNEQAARTAHDKINKGTSLKDMSKEKDVKIQELGLMEKTQLPEAVGNDVFAISEKQATKPIQDEFGWHIFVVTKIEPTYIQPYEQVKTIIENDLKTQKISDTLHDLRNKVEDALAGGATLAEVAKVNNLGVESFPAVNKKGLDLEDKPASSFEFMPQVVEQAFNTPEGTESPLTEAKGGILFVVRVEKVTPSYLPEFEETKARVERAWFKNKQMQTAAELAALIARNVHSVDEFESMASSHKLEVEILGAISRNRSTKDERFGSLFPQDFMRQMFTLPLGKALYCPSRDGYIVVMLQKIEPLDEDSYGEPLSNFHQALNKLAQKDLENLYLHTLSKRYPVVTNQSVLDSVLNRDQ